MQTIDCGGWVHSVSFADGSFLATGDQRKMASLWHVASGELVYELECPGEVHSVAISPDKRTLLVGDGSGRGHKWVTASGACLQSIECGTGEVSLPQSHTPHTARRARVEQWLSTILYPCNPSHPHLTPLTKGEAFSGSRTANVR
eukprot:2933905-Prymnesium_polylepis.1